MDNRTPVSPGYFRSFAVLILLMAFTAAYAWRPMTGVARTFSEAMIESTGASLAEDCPELKVTDAMICGTTYVPPASFRRFWDAFSETEAETLGVELESKSDWSIDGNLHVRLYWLNGEQYTVAVNYFDSGLAAVILLYDDADLTEAEPSLGPPQAAPILPEDRSYRHDPQIAEMLPYKVSEKTDSAGKSIHSMNNALRPANLSRGVLEINLSLIEDDSATTLELRFFFVGELPMHLIEGESLLFNIDGETIVLSTNSEVRTAEDELLSFQFGNYDISPELVRRIGNADRVSVQIFGRSRSFEREFSAENKQRFKDFYSTYLRNIQIAEGSRPNSAGVAASASSPNLPTGEAAEKVDAVIRSTCRSEWPGDARMRDYCIERQNEAVRELNRLAANYGGIPTAAFTTAYTSCYRDWREDYAMQFYCTKQQIEAYHAVKGGPSYPGLSMSAGERQTIQNQCRSAWSGDFTMQASCEKQQSEGLAYLKAQPVGVSSNSWEAAVTSCRSDWRDDYTMQAYCVRNETK